MTDKEKIQLFVELAPFLSQVLGPGCEVVIHDARDYDHSLIHIENSISGRSVGGPMTELARNILESYKDSDQSYLTNYIGQVKNKEFLDSTYFIKNKGRIIGFLCINKDMDGVRGIHSSVTALLRAYNLCMPEDSAYLESLEEQVDDVMRERIAKVIEQTGISPARMSLEERLKVIGTLRDSGVLTMKGAIAELAEQMGVSVPTIYRYLKKLQ